MSALRILERVSVTQANAVKCSRCGASRPVEVADESPRSPCPACGATQITRKVEIAVAEEISVADGVSAALSPADQSRGWKRRWAEAHSTLDGLLAPSEVQLSADAIHDARGRLHSFFVQTYHIKDSLKEEASSTGVAPVDVERAISNDPRLALLADLANLDKHGNLNKPPRSGAVPVIGAVRGNTAGLASGWRLELEIAHAGSVKDGLTVARDAVAAWRDWLGKWNLI